MGANQGKPSRQDLIDELDGLRGQLAAEAPKRPSAPQAASSSSGVRLPGRVKPFNLEIRTIIDLRC
jgi:hypothetical protein